MKMILLIMTKYPLTLWYMYNKRWHDNKMQMSVFVMTLCLRWLQVIGHLRIYV